MPSVTFRYLLNGNTVTFTQQVDIDSMKGHPEYVLVEDTPVATPAAPIEAPKKAGRPAKVVAEVE